MSHAQLLGEKLYFDSHLDNYEAIAKETVKNAFAVFGEMQIIGANGSYPNAILTPF